MVSFTNSCSHCVRGRCRRVDLDQPACSGRRRRASLRPARRRFLAIRPFRGKSAFRPGCSRVDVVGHQRIVDAIAKHDGDGAAEAMRAHLNRANELYRTLGQV
ncbi:FCD domain-containing protein [Paraburkholderia graminis]|uniref:FCD domain-containing protein n=1 Tax=Paraburkholderia graminis TaxID=60548 RepID=UPI0038B9CEDF